jgi:hypothetical protein
MFTAENIPIVWMQDIMFGGMRDARFVASVASTAASKPI